MPDDAPLLPGTLDLLILKTLTMGVLHGYGIAQNIRRLSFKASPTGRQARFYIVLGVAGALMIGRLLKARLYGLESVDARTYVVSVLGLGVVAALACVIPALRAARIAPAQVLRNE